MAASPVVLAGLLALAIAMPAAAQAPEAARQPVPDPAAAEIAALQRKLQSAQQEIAGLRTELTKQRDLAALLGPCREKNARLVGIGNDLITAYDRRYRHGRSFAPFEVGRRKFEAEMQDIGDRIYDNRLEAGPRRAKATTDSDSSQQHVQ